MNNGINIKVHGEGRTWRKLDYYVGCFILWTSL